MSPPNHVQYGLLKIYEVINAGKLVYGFPSLVDRVYPIFYSIKSLLNGYIFGMGPGADWLFKDIVFDPSFLNAVLPYKSSTSIMNSFTAKLMLYWGIIPFILIGEWIRRVTKVSDFSNSKDRMYLFILASVFSNSFFGLGNFTFPYVWFWIGVSSVYFFKRPCEKDQEHQSKNRSLKEPY